MVTKKKSKRISAERRKVLERQKKIKKAAEKAEEAAKRTYAFAQKHVTKENVNKAIAASKRATTALKNLFKKKKAVPQRTTMTLYRK